MAVLLTGASPWATAAFPDRFGVYIDNGLGGSIAEQTSADFASVSVSYAVPVLDGNATAGANAMGAYTMTSTSVEPAEHSQGAVWRLRAGAGSTYYDALITGTGDTLVTPLQLSLDGFLSGVVQARPGGSERANQWVTSDVYVSVLVYDCPRADCGSVRDDGFRELSVDEVGQGVASSGFLGTSGAWISATGSESIHAVIGTDPIAFPVNRLFSFEVAITTVTTGGNSYSYSYDNLAQFVTGAADFSHTLGLPAGVPLLTLPDGFRFDAASVGIENNLCVGNACVAAPVPEPPTWLMWLSALSAVPWLRWKRRQHRPHARGADWLLGQQTRRRPDPS